MPINAGQRITAARLNWDSDDATLSDDTAAAVNTWEQWGTETITFPNPGVAVKVKAWLTGRIYNIVDATSNAQYRVSISFDGGSTFTTGQAAPINVGTGSGDTERLPAAQMHFRDDTPTGDIVVKAELRADDLSVNFTIGTLMADMIPQ